jgi:hypothetical protein
VASVTYESTVVGDVGICPILQAAVPQMKKRGFGIKKNGKTPVLLKGRGK